MHKTLFFPSEAQENPSSNDAQPEKARPKHNTSQPPEDSRPNANATGKGGVPNHEEPHWAEEIATTAEPTHRTARSRATTAGKAHRKWAKRRALYTGRPNAF